MNATGEKRPLACANEFNDGMAFETMHFDNVFGDLRFADGNCTPEISDPESGCTLRMTFDQTFRECVVYTPPHREAICIEPYTCVPDPFRLARLGIDAGLRVLQPGESLTAHVDIELVRST